MNEVTVNTSSVCETNEPIGGLCDNGGRGGRLPRLGCFGRFGYGKQWETQNAKLDCLLPLGYSHWYGLMDGWIGLVGLVGWMDWLID